jgi:hypothetical protein
MNKVPGIWKWMVGLLFVLNLALLATIWFKPGDKQLASPGVNGGERPNEFIERKLHFSAEQVSAFDVLRKRHHDSIMTLQQQGRELRDQYFDNLKHPETVDSNNVNRIALAIADNQKEIELVTYRHFRQVRQLCNEQQKPVFDDIIDEVLRMMSRPQGRGPERQARPEGRAPGGHRPPPPQQ